MTDARLAGGGGVRRGIVTVEDVVEQVVGDLRDDFGRASIEPSIERRADGSYAVDGAVALETIADELGAGFERDGVDTIGGLVFSRLGRAPAVGDRVELPGYALEVTDVDGARISTVTVEPTEGTEEPSETDADSPGDDDSSAGEGSADRGDHAD